MGVIGLRAPEGGPIGDRFVGEATVNDERLRDKEELVLCNDGA
jgi:hypothetical protein